MGDSEQHDAEVVVDVWREWCRGLGELEGIGTRLAYLRLESAFPLAYKTYHEAAQVVMARVEAERPTAT